MQNNPKRSTINICFLYTKPFFTLCIEQKGKDVNHAMLVYLRPYHSVYWNFLKKSLVETLVREKGLYLIQTKNTILCKNTQNIQYNL